MLLAAATYSYNAVVDANAHICWRNVMLAASVSALP